MLTTRTDTPAPVTTTDVVPEKPKDGTEPNADIAPTAPNEPAAQPGAPAPEGLEPKTQRTTRSHDRRVQWRIEQPADLPKGVCGRITGVALRYNVVDDYRTVFVPGCLDKSKGQRVKAGKVQLYVADDGAFHSYGVRMHIGVVRTMETVGDDELITADLFDTADGRKVKEYVQAVTQAGGFTGISIGFKPVASDIRDWPMDGGSKRVEAFTECIIVENTITPVPAVPGTEVMAVRSVAALEGLLRSALRHLPADRVDAILNEHRTAHRTTEARPAAPAAKGIAASDARESATVSMAERTAAFRRTFAPSTRE